MRRITFALVVSALLVAAACGSEEPAEQATPRATAEPSDASSAAGGTTLSSGSCVEQYSLETLKNRDYAFDGTITDVKLSAADEPDSIVFRVTEWYKGGSGAETTRKAYGVGGVTSVGGGDRKVGDHLLVAGDDDFMWECGFTQPYDTAVAADWASALE